MPLKRIDAAGGVLYYHQDQLGSTRLLTDGAGNVAGTYSYDAYGKPSSSTGSVSQPFGFAGEYTDAETGFVYLRNRYYDPATGQFISRDPIAPLTQEPYGYVGGNPLNYTDPMGLGPLDWVKERVKEAVTPFQVAWTSVGFFIVRPLAYAALVAAGVTGAPLLIALGFISLAWLAAGWLLKEHVIDPCHNTWG
jgi:RHS repeat-associated protein